MAIAIFSRILYFFLHDWCIERLDATLIRLLPWRWHPLVSQKIHAACHVISNFILLPLLPTYPIVVRHGNGTGGTFATIAEAHRVDEGGH